MPITRSNLIARDSVASRTRRAQTRDGGVDQIVDGKITGEVALSDDPLKSPVQREGVGGDATGAPDDGNDLVDIEVLRRQLAAVEREQELVRLQLRLKKAQANLARLRAGMTPTLSDPDRINAEDRTPVGGSTPGRETTPANGPVAEDRDWGDDDLSDEDSDQGERRARQTRRRRDSIDRKGVVVKPLKKFKESSSYQEREDWIKAIELVFKGAPRRYRRDRIKVIKGLSNMEAKCQQRWKQYLDTIEDESERVRTRESWKSFVDWTADLPPEAGLVSVNALRRWIRATQIHTQSPHDFHTYLVTLESKMGKMPETVCRDRFYLGLMPEVRMALAQFTMSESVTRRTLLERAEIIWKETQAQKRRALQRRKRENKRRSRVWVDRLGVRRQPEQGRAPHQVAAIPR